MTNVDYSIVIPVYFNEGCLAKTVESIKREVIEKKPNLTCEIIFVDDGSEDRSLEELLNIRKKDPDLVKIIKLTRNFGQANALLAGFKYARGKCVVAMSADGQDPTVLINDMLDAHINEGYEVVIATRTGRDESWYRIITSKLFYALIRKMTFPSMPLGGFDFVLMGEHALKVFLRNMDAHPFFQGQILWMGFTPKTIEYHRRERIAGRSRWTFGRKLTYLIDGVLSYSFAPIRAASLSGIILAFLGFLYAFVIFFSKLFWGNPVQGWAPIMIMVLIIGGFQLLMIGIIGEYLWRTLAQVRKRDMYIIDKLYGDFDE